MIKLTNFALRHFDKNFTGTKLNISPEEFESYIRNEIHSIQPNKMPDFKNDQYHIRHGEFSFSRLITIPNIFGCDLSNMEITDDNSKYLVSGYSSRVPEELPVLSRWFELPIEYKSKLPKCENITIVLYSRDQLNKENPDSYFEYDWGIVAILSHDGTDPEPIPPITMFRNSLGVKQGGNGVPLNKEKYLLSVDYWNKRANIK